MFFQQFTTPGLGCFSYMIGCPLKGVAAVVDPRRDIAIYLEAAKNNRMRITHVFDTHVHADHITGTRELSRATGADIYIHESAPVGYEAKKLKHGDTFDFGGALIKVLHTPGHTPNSISLVVTDVSRDKEVPEMILTGDLLFVGDTGRPDLPGEEILDEQVRNLYDSLNKTLADLPDGIEVYPAHGAGSLCGAGMSAKPHSTLGYERRTNPRMRLKSFEDFKKDILSYLPMRPQSFSHIIATNLKGAPLLPLQDDSDPALTVAQVEELSEAGAVLLDLREMLSFAAAHIPGSVNVDASSPPAPNWIGTVVAPKSRLVLIMNNNAEYRDRLKELHRIGYDDVAGFLNNGIQAWMNAGKNIQSLRFISPVDLKQKLASPKPPVVIDVRTKKEFDGKKIASAQHLPFDRLLAENTCPASKDEESVVVCLSGYRSAIAASVLQARGCSNLSVLAGGMGAY